MFLFFEGKIQIFENTMQRFSDEIIPFILNKLWRFTIQYLSPLIFDPNWGLIFTLFQAIFRFFIIAIVSIATFSATCMFGVSIYISWVVLINNELLEENGKEIKEKKS